MARWDRPAGPGPSAGPRLPAGLRLPAEGGPEGGWTPAGGFALPVVVFLLFAIGMAAATGYLVVDLEADMATQSTQAAQARSVARAGLQRYVGEHLGIPRDSTVYSIGNGQAVVRARRLAVVDSLEGIDLYLIESEGRVADPRNPLSPARRRVAQYAHLHREPVGRVAVAQLSYNTVDVDNWAYINGFDHSSGACPASGAEDLVGVGHRGSVDVSASGMGSASAVEGASHPPGFSAPASGGIVSEWVFPSHQALYDSVGVRWDILTDPTFPVPYDNVRPDFWSLPSDEFPVTRVRGDLFASAIWSGRGVLIVTGQITFGSGFYWNGVILAGDVSDVDGRIFWVRGMLVGGLNGGGGQVEFDGYPLIYYDVCSTLAASNALAFFEPVDETWWEVP